MMIDRLVTYLPFNRIHEVLEYFEPSVQNVQPKEAIIYVDNVFHPKQLEILNKIIPENIKIRYGNWRSRDMTWIQMFEDMQGSDALFMDSDNVIDPWFLQIHEQLKEMGIYSVLDFEEWHRGAKVFLAKSKKIKTIEITVESIVAEQYYYQHQFHIEERTVPIEVYSFPIYDPTVHRGGNVFFIGPKQLIYFRKMPDYEIVEKLKKAVEAIPPEFRNLVSDETLLGIAAYLMGYREIPWVVGSHHHQHGSGFVQSKPAKAIGASGHLYFAKALSKEFKMKEFSVYKQKYVLPTIKNALNLLR